MAEKYINTAIRREEGYLYFIDKQGDISRIKMARGRKGRGSPEKVKQVGLERETGYLYFVDKQGDVYRSKLMRGRKKKKLKG